MKKVPVFPIIGGVLLCALGLLLIVKPAFSMQIIMICIGAVFLIRGFISLFTYISSHERFPFSGGVLAQAMIDFAFGLLIAFGSGFVSSALAVILGLWALISGGIELGMVYQNRQDSLSSHWKKDILSCILQIIFGIVCIISPMWGAAAVMILCGIAIMLSGIATIYFSIRFGK